MGTGLVIIECPESPASAASGGVSSMNDFKSPPTIDSIPAPPEVEDLSPPVESATPAQTHIQTGPPKSARAWMNQAPAQAVQLPERIGRYQVKQILGQGAFGCVYLAQDDQLNRPVAIKVP